LRRDAPPRARRIFLIAAQGKQTKLDCAGECIVSGFDIRHRDVVDAADPSGLVDMPGMMLMVMDDDEPTVERDELGAIADHWMIRQILPFCDVHFDSFANPGQQVLCYGAAEALELVDAHLIVRRPEREQLLREARIVIARYRKSGRGEPPRTIDQGVHL